MQSDSTELQRSGRDKSVSINHSYINSGEYKRKFDNITDNPKLNKLLYHLAKKMLTHRSGSNYEDMYWINIETLQIIARKLIVRQNTRYLTLAKQNNKLNLQPNSKYPL